MKTFIKLCFGYLICFSAFSKSLDLDQYWQCTTKDQEQKSWSITNSYQKMALNLAFAACKKESAYPSTCKTSNNDCESFINGVSTRPLWRCTALDCAASIWQSNYYVTRDDAALAAKAYCKSHSSLPDSCYINLVTCKNVNSLE